MDEENAYLHTAEVVLRTVADLMEHPELRVSKDGYEERKKFYMEHWLHSVE